jgi:hypothetical protein
MKELFDALIAYKIGDRFRRLIFVSLIVLIAFHSLVLISPFISIEKSQPFFTEKQIDNLRVASDSLANITVALILMLIIVEGQNGLRVYIMKQRQGTYKRIRDEILDWMKVTKPFSFDEEDHEAKFIYGGRFSQSDALQHLKVTGSLSKIMKIFGYPEELRDAVRVYSECVHFELTRYPAELLYGIHFEIDDYDISQKLCAALSDLLNLERQSVDFKADIITPKKPGWIFLTRTVDLTGNVDKDFAKAMTHARHFVELVCHSYDSLYSKRLIDLYLQLVGKLEDKVTLSNMK